MFSAVNTIWVLVGAALVFFMQAGFAMVVGEPGRILHVQGRDFHGHQALCRPAGGGATDCESLLRTERERRCI